MYEQNNIYGNFYWIKAVENGETSRKDILHIYKNPAFPKYGTKYLCDWIKINSAKNVIGMHIDDDFSNIFSQFKFISIIR